MTMLPASWSSASLALRSLLWTILLPGFFAGYVPWRFFGLGQARFESFGPGHLLALLCIGLGATLLAACIVEFARSGRGTLSPVDPPRRLVTRGLYRYVRNPMYLSVTTIVLGEVLLTRSPELAFYWGLWFLGANLFVIGYEEPTLRRRFGGAYDEYAQQVGRWLPRFRTRQKASWEHRVAAVLEIIGVFVAGTLLARLASRGLNLGPVNLRALAPGEEPEFLALARSTAANLLLRYGFVLGLAFVVGWWHRRRRLADYGVTTAGCPVRDHVSTAVLLFAAAGLPALGLKFLADVLPLGQGPQHWALTQALDRPGIWLYLFVGSFGLVPIVEELFARGYVQSRLAEDFGAPAAILMTAIFFTLSHTQYFIAGVLGVGMLTSLFVASVAAGYVRYRTGSLLPGIVAHALGNLPFRGWVVPAVLALMALLVVIWWRAIARYANRLWHEVVIRDAIVAVGQAIVVLFVLLAEVMFAPSLLPGSAALALAIALLLEFREKRSTPALQPMGAQ